MTPQEREVLDALVKEWRKFAEMDKANRTFHLGESPDTAQFCYGSERAHTQCSDELEATLQKLAREVE